MRKYKAISAIQIFLKYKGMKYKGYYFIAPMYIVRILLESRWYIQMGGARRV